LREDIALYGVALIGYCLMSNHIHLIAIPHKVDGLAQALKQAHGRCATVST
jgi:putative transposase